MVLLQVYIDGEVGTSATTYCSLYGKYKVRLLSYDIKWSAQPGLAMKLKSNNLIGNFSSIAGMYRNSLILGTNSQNVCMLSGANFEFITDNINGKIDLALTDMLDLDVVGLTYAIFNFDFEKVEG